MHHRTLHGHSPGLATGLRAVRVAILALAAETLIAVTKRLHKRRTLDRRQVRAGLSLATALNRKAWRLLREPRDRSRTRD